MCSSMHKYKALSSLYWAAGNEARTEPYRTPQSLILQISVFRSVEYSVLTGIIKDYPRVSILHPYHQGHGSTYMSI